MKRVVLVLVFISIIAVNGSFIASANPGGAVIESSVYTTERWIDGASQGLFYKYSTMTGDGKPATSTSVAFVPTGQAPTGGWPVVAWAHGTTGIADHCAPSKTGNFSRDPQLLTNWLKRGFAIVATDYIGLGTPGVHRYLDVKSEARAIVDSVRAARVILPDLSARWVAVGQSQGGGAALGAANIANQYAPELDFRGAVATGPASNIDALLGSASPAIPTLPLSGTTTFISYIIAGLRDANPEIDAASVLTPLGEIAANAAEELCFEEFASRFRGVTVAQLFSRPLDDPAIISASQAYLSVPVVGYDRPLFIGQGVFDSVTPLPLTLKLVTDLYAHEQDVTFRTYDAEHVPTAALAQDEAIPFVARLVR